MRDELTWFGRTLVIAPHPDDEILGAGGTIAKLVHAGIRVEVAIVTVGSTIVYPAAAIKQVREEALNAHKCLGVQKTYFLDLPAAQLTEVATADLNEKIGRVVRESQAQTVLVPHPGDIHVDHQLVFRSTLVACRPHQKEFARNILAYETLSETNWNAPYLTPAFVPNVFIEISDFLDRKIEAMNMFASQVRPEPHERSLGALRALATLRGATIHAKSAEGFVLVRHVC